jgi:hypothetical protein
MGFDHQRFFSAKRAFSIGFSYNRCITIRTKVTEADQQFDYMPDKTPPEGKKDSGNSISWTASEYIDHQIGVSWYFILLIATIALAAVIYVLLKDVFATGVILVLGLIVGLAAKRKPEQATYRLSRDGLAVGEKLYPFSHFRSFAIMREGQLTSLVLIPLKRLMPPISAFFDEGDEDRIVSIIGEHLPLEQRSPDRIDNLSRRLRF